MVRQIELCVAIMKEIECQGVKGAIPRQMSAIAEAANIICDEFAKPYRPSIPGGGVTQWERSDDTGTSSKYMLYAMGRSLGGEFGYPHDPSDFGRCIGLLDAEPTLRERLPMMLDAEKHGREWAALAANWNELEALYREELPTGNAPKLMARMTELYKECRCTN